MNPAYRHARLRAELPHGGLPESLAVITACNLQGTTIPDEENAARTEESRRQLVRLGLDHFPVAGFDPHSPHKEPGFGVTCDLATAYAMGNAFEQEAAFWIHRGQVTLIPIGGVNIPVPTADQRQECRSSLGSWSTMTESPAAHPRFHFRGPFSLLEKPATAFLYSTRCPGDKILEAYEWARHQCEIGGTVISGFHTPVEKDLLAILLRRGAKILCVTARDLPKAQPKELKPAAIEGRLMILSPFDYGKVIRPSRDSCSARNCFVLDLAKDHYIPHIADGCYLAQDIESYTQKVDLS